MVKFDKMMKNGQKMNQNDWKWLKRWLKISHTSKTMTPFDPPWKMHNNDVRFVAVSLKL